MVNLARFKRLRQALELLWTDTCTVYTKERQRDPETGIVSFSEMAKWSGLSCKLSYDTMRFKTNVIQTSTPEEISNITLFLGKDVDTASIPAGSKIVIQHNGDEVTYAYSGIAKTHSNHQEIALREWNGWA